MKMREFQRRIGHKESKFRRSVKSEPKDKPMIFLTDKFLHLESRIKFIKLQKNFNEIENIYHCRFDKQIIRENKISYFK